MRLFWFVSVAWLSGCATMSGYTTYEIPYTASIHPDCVVEKFFSDPKFFGPNQMGFDIQFSNPDDVDSDWTISFSRDEKVTSHKKAKLIHFSIRVSDYKRCPNIYDWKDKCEVNAFNANSARVSISKDRENLRKRISNTLMACGINEINDPRLIEEPTIR